MYPVNNDYKIMLPPKIEGFTTEENTEMNSEIMDALNNNLLTCEPVDENDQSMINENTATYLVDGSKDILNTQSALGIAFIIILVAIVSSYLGAPLFYK